MTPIQTSGEKPVIELKNVNKHYGSLHVLKDISLSVGKGEVVVVIGPSGSGKSTLCRTINRLETIDSGQILIDGVPLPQAIRNILPALGNEFVVNIKDTSVLNVISVTELFFVSKSAAGTYFKYYEVFFITACVYFVMTFTVTRILRWLEKKMDGPENYAIHGSQTVPSVELINKGGDQNG